MPLFYKYIFIQVRKSLNISIFKIKYNVSKDMLVSLNLIPKPGSFLQCF